MAWYERFRRPATVSPGTRLRFRGRPAAYAPDGWMVPVVAVSYIPVSGERIDRRATGDVDASLAAIRGHIASTTARILEVLETGSVYHGYKEPTALASLQYDIVHQIEILEPLPTWRKPGHSVPMTDYNAIMERIGGESWIRNHGVKEVWVWGYHGGVVDLWESNMAGPFGDISNSDRDPTDLPVFDQTYSLFHYNYGRGPSEAVENHLHQIEALVRSADEELFWNRFVGSVGAGRCGWSHFPPNGRRDYDWANPSFIDTDIEDWRPDGSGAHTRMNCDRWGGDSLTWFTYWMQNLPGRDSGLSWRGRPLRNWWELVGAFDEAMSEGGGLTRK